MSHIWHALVPDPKATVDANYAPICKELLKEMGGRLWRNREASASGLADLLQVRHAPLPEGGTARTTGALDHC